MKRGRFGPVQRTEFQGRFGQKEEQGQIPAQNF
jgi:hypothetical protein